MSGPYIDGLGTKKRRRCENAVLDSDESSSFFSSSDDEEILEKQRRYKKRRVTQTDAEVIPTFRPDEKSSNVKGWLHKIDQLGDVYGWDNKDRQFIMQIRLRGSARDCAVHHSNYTTASHPRPTTTWRREGAVATIARGSDFQPKKCYACRREGHEAKDCKVPRCEVCHRPGHTSASCWHAASSSHQKVPYSSDKPGANSSADLRGTRHTQDGRMLSINTSGPTYTASSGTS
ncbi:uncharacterized protein LOC125071083 [Vanessa atalanta]|uniref:uncharacterized protein LOC125071083 n=1 Tax=Vanessa atalanta TaxID=42275 RepID=UPI001FCDC8B5|nr:uncharacterized protein LOC125071083 [Vanessa atalanta]